LIDFVWLKESLRTSRCQIGERRRVEGGEIDHAALRELIDDQVHELDLARG
jgi:hypothetical protein